MFNFLKPRPKQVPPADAVALLDELNALIAAELASRPKPSPFFMNLFRPEDPIPSDPLMDASVYLGYGHFSAAAEVLREGLSQPGVIEAIHWVPNSREYAETVLARLDALAAAQGHG